MSSPARNRAKLKTDRMLVMIHRLPTERFRRRKTRFRCNCPRFEKKPMTPLTRNATCVSSLFFAFSFLVPGFGSRSNRSTYESSWSVKVFGVQSRFRLVEEKHSVSFDARTSEITDDVLLSWEIESRVISVLWLPNTGIHVDESCQTDRFGVGRYGAIRLVRRAFKRMRSVGYARIRFMHEIFLRTIVFKLWGTTSQTTRVARRFRLGRFTGRAPNDDFAVSFYLIVKITRDA